MEKNQAEIFSENVHNHVFAQKMKIFPSFQVRPKKIIYRMKSK